MSEHERSSHPDATSSEDALPETLSDDLEAATSLAPAVEPPLTPGRGESATPPSSALFLAVALLSAAVLGFEISLSRVFAVLLRYQFAFLVVSLALCGLGLGGLLAHARPKMSLAKVAVGWGVAVVISLGLILRGVFAYVPEHYWMAALLVLVPFGVAGTFLSLAFGRYGQWGGRLYGYDLAGAALAAGGSVLLMQGVGAINACLFFAALGALAAVLVAAKKTVPIAVTFVLLALVPLNARSNIWSVQPIPPKPIPAADQGGRQPGEPPRMETLADRGITQPLFTELGAPDKPDPRDKKRVLPRSRIVDTRWNAFARTDVVVDPDVVADPEHPSAYLLYTNGNVPTNMLKWDGKLLSLPDVVSEFSLSNWAFYNAHIKGKKVLSIGPGGGLDALLALTYGAERFDGAEINPSIVGLMNEPKYRAFNGGIYQHDRIHVQTAEGRAFVREAKQRGERYQLIFSALTKTATAGQGAALLESYIYTTDAFNDYMGALNDDGQLIIVGDAFPLLARLFTTSLDHFMALGENQRQAGGHVAIVYTAQPGPYAWALVVKKSTISADEATSMSDTAAKNRMQPLWIPGRASFDEPFPFGSTASGALAYEGFLRMGDSPELPTRIDFSPCPDDRPFLMDLGKSPWSIFSQSASLTIMLGLSVVGTLGLATMLLSGTNRGARAGLKTQDGFAVLYFLALGIGFMLVEVPLIQKLVLPLGYPTLSLSVILFSILLGGGAGALFSQRYQEAKLRQHAMACALGVTILAALIGSTSGTLSNILLPLALPVRCLIAAALLLPLGFLIGTPFPSGMRLFAHQRPEMVPLIWALNGTSSVVGSLAAAVLAKVAGFGLVLIVGALIYLGAAALLFVSRPVESSEILGEEVAV